MKDIIKPVDTDDGLFHDGDPSTGVEGTIVYALIMNALQGGVMSVQRELKNILQSADINIDDSNDAQVIAALEKLFQPLNKSLTALAGLVTGENKLPYFTDTDIAAVTALTEIGRDIIGKNSVADVLTYLGLGELVLAGTITGSFDTNGYLMIPVIIGGVKKDLIVQWGQGNNTASATSQISYPIPFPNKVFQVVAMGFQVAGNQQSYVTLNSTAPLDRFTWNGFFAAGGSAPVLSTQAGQVSCRYIAIGW